MRLMTFVRLWASLEALLWPPRAWPGRSWKIPRACWPSPRLLPLSLPEAFTLDLNCAGAVWAFPAIRIRHTKKRKSVTLTPGQITGLWAFKGTSVHLLVPEHNYL